MSEYGEWIYSATIYDYNGVIKNEYHKNRLMINYDRYLDYESRWSILGTWYGSTLEEAITQAELECGGNVEMSS
jgi:hypothetical protein